MATLLSGYGSSDDEDQPVPSSSKSHLPKIGHPTTETPQVDEDETDEAVEAAARADAFGLSTTAQSRTSVREKKAEVAAAPDVLKEDPNVMSNAIITRPTDKVMNVNISYADMQLPVQGPEDPFNQRKNKGMNSLAGKCILNVVTGAELRFRSCGRTINGRLHLRDAIPYF